MKRNLLAAMFLLQSMTLGSGSPSFANATIPVDIQPTSYATVSQATVVQVGNRLLISGVLTRPGEVHLPGHVDFVIVGQDGSVLEKRTICVNGLASNRKGRMDLHFGTSIELGIPVESRAVLRYHAPGDSPGNC